MTNPIVRLTRTGLVLAGVIALTACAAPDYRPSDTPLDRAKTNLDLILDVSAVWAQQPDEEGVMANYDITGTAAYVGGLPVLTRADVTCQGFGESIQGTRAGDQGSCTLVTDDGTLGIEFIAYGTLADGLRGSGTVTETSGSFAGADGTVFMQTSPIAGTRTETIAVAAEITWVTEPGADAEADGM